MRENEVGGGIRRGDEEVGAGMRRISFSINRALKDLL